MKTQVNYLTQRANTQEETNIKVDEKLQLLQKQIIELKNPSSPTFAQVTGTTTSREFQHNPSQTDAAREDSSKDIKVRKIISDGRRVIGLSQNDIDIEKENGIENEEESMTAAAKSFFTGDMNIPESTLKKLKIVKVFKPANADETDKLYADMRNSADAADVSA